MEAMCVQSTIYRCIDDFDCWEVLGGQGGK
jgi:hypothetical protein